MPETARPIEARLTTFDASMVVVSLVIGIGIFRAPAIVAKEAGGTTLFYAAWILGGIVSLIGALTFAEIGSRHPRAGGYYRVVADCFHPALAFMLNWAQTLMQGAGAAGVAFIGAEYLSLLVLPPGARGPSASLALACALMVLLLVLNYIGVKTGARAQNLLSLLKIAMIVVLAVCALALDVAPPVPGFAPAPQAAAMPLQLGFLAAAVIPVFYTMGGYQMTMNLGADVKDAPRKLPIAVAGGMAMVVGLYILINIAYERTLGVAGIAESKLVAAALARAAFGASGEAVVSLAIFLSAAGFVNATILQMPRSFHAMAEDGVLPAAFRRVNPRTQVSEVGLLFFGVTMLVPAFLLGSFEKLLNYVMFTDSLTLVVVASTLFVLRKRNAGGAGAAGVFRIPGYPVLPALYLAVILAVSLHILVLETRLALAGMAILAMGYPLFVLGRRLSGGTSTG